MRVPHSFSTFLTFWLSKQSSEYFKMYWVFGEVNLVKGTLTGNVAKTEKHSCVFSCPTSWFLTDDYVYILGS